MSAEESKVQNETAAPEWLRSEDGVAEIYADYFYVNWMPVSVRLRFAQVVPGHQTPAPNWVLDERLGLTLPWPTVKSLAEFLTNLVAAYERDNGEITIPKIPSL